VRSKEQPLVLLVDDDKDLATDVATIRSASDGIFDHLEFLSEFVRPREPLAALEAVLARLKKECGPTVVVLDYDLGVSKFQGNKYANEAADLFGCPPDTETIDGLILTKALLENTSLEPLLLVESTQKGVGDYMTPHKLEEIAADKFGRDLNTLRVEGRENLKDISKRRGLEGPADVMRRINDWPTYLGSLRKVWDDWALKHNFLRYWAEVWRADATLPGHLEDRNLWPEGRLTDGLLQQPEQEAVDAFKCVFCLRGSIGTTQSEEMIHVSGVPDQMSLEMAEFVLGQVISDVGAECTLKWGTDAAQQMHWPSAPGAFFLWRMQLFLASLKPPLPSVVLGFDPRTHEGHVTLQMAEPWHFWAAVKTRRDGGAVGAFRDLLACAPPGAEAEWIRISSVEKYRKGIAVHDDYRSRQPNARVGATGVRPVAHPMFRVDVQDDGLLLSWPVSRKWT